MNFELKILILVAQPTVKTHQPCLEYLHTAIFLVGINERYPCGGHVSMQCRGVQVGVVLVPGDSDLLIVRGLCAKVPHGVG